MAEKASLILRLIASSAVATRRAGKIITDIMNRADLGIVQKGSADLQTEADRSAQRCIVASLSLQYPSITIIGEENIKDTEVPSDWIVTDVDQSILSQHTPPEYNEVVEKDVVVWVDPLDGTSEYTQGLYDHVTVLVGLSIKGKAVGGVIHQPYFNYQKSAGDNLGRTLWGLVGLGIGGFTVTPPPSDRFIITTTRSHTDRLVQAAVLSLNPDEILRVGGAGHKVILLLEGRAHLYLFASDGTKKWDSCAPEAVLEAAGGKFTDIHGGHYDYSATTPLPNTTGILATAPKVNHDIILRKLPEYIRQALL